MALGVTAGRILAPGDHPRRGRLPRPLRCRCDRIRTAGHRWLHPISKSWAPGPSPTPGSPECPCPPGRTDRRPEVSCDLPDDACCMVQVHIVIVGCGRVGSGLGMGLVEQGHSVAIIDRNAKAFRRLPADWAGTTVVGSGFDREDLDRAGAGEAKSLAAVTSGDNSNILTARIARETYEIPNVVARIYDPRRAQIYLRLGIPTVATVSWTIDQVRRRLVPNEVESEWTDSDRDALAGGAGAARAVGRQTAGRSERPRRGDGGGGDQGRRGPPRLRGPGRPGRRRDPPDGHRQRPGAAERPTGRHHLAPAARGRTVAPAAPLDGVGTPSPAPAGDGRSS